MKLFQQYDGSISNNLLLVNSNDLLETDYVDKNYIRKLRKERGLTLQELADRIGTSNQQVSFHEAGKRKLTWEWIKKYAAALDCTPHEITDGDAAPLAATSAQEKNLLTMLRQMTEPEQAKFINMAEAFVGPVSSTKKKSK